MDVFVCDPLMSPVLMAAVIGQEVTDPLPAVLPDHAVHQKAEDGAPFIATNSGGHAPGLIWCDLPVAAIDRLNLYHSVFGAVPVPAQAVVAGEFRDVQIYLSRAPADPGIGDWSLPAWEAVHLRPAVLAVEELFSLDPMPAPALLRQQWPQIMARAWARDRVVAAPATLRREAVVGDITVQPNAPPMGEFFRFQGFDISHIRFDGTRSPVMQREGFIGFDAAIVLPYDPIRDKVLLLEQLRVGPILRHDSNPWMLEPVAGIVDARETPEQAAMRETGEEAGLIPRQLIPAGSYYPSPGSTTEYFYTFIALCDLVSDAPYAGGLDAEGEDLRLHPLSFDAAMALADSGEIAAGPLLTLLYWLARHRDRLRGMG
ncbi:MULTISPECIES: NUDIX domain-containing protein [unclassified Yoonia]|uniref:NUDIX domain-containing protein n=1 Tax=unclassified Yoonia TaxID=2629118 RepID=UPI002AFEA7D5|nr:MULTISPECIES: NUDIX domain-containing protein [unclassified Yoonia]